MGLPFGLLVCIDDRRQHHHPLWLFRYGIPPRVIGMRYLMLVGRLCAGDTFGGRGISPCRAWLGWSREGWIAFGSWTSRLGLGCPFLDTVSYSFTSPIGIVVDNFFFLGLAFDGGGHRDVGRGDLRWDERESNR